jgi:tight adherence protein B
MTLPTSRQQFAEMLKGPSRRRALANEMHAYSELLAALATECACGEQMQRAFTLATTATDLTAIRGMSLARHVNLAGENPFTVLTPPPQLRGVVNVLAIAWLMCARSGASFVPAAEYAQTMVLQRMQSYDSIAEEMAGIQLSARALLSLPLLGVVMGPLIGSNPIGWLIGTNLGRAIALVGCGLHFIGWRWSRAIVHKATHIEDNAIAVLAQLLAMATAVGVSDFRSLLAHVAETTNASELYELLHALDTGVVAEEAWSMFRSRYPQWGSICSVMIRSARTGAPAAMALTGIANRLMQSEKSQLLRRIRRSGVGLLLPLGLCGLPAFMLLSVVPLIASYFATAHIVNL